MGGVSQTPREGGARSDGRGAEPGRRGRAGSSGLEWTRALPPPLKAGYIGLTLPREPLPEAPHSLLPAHLVNPI